jgi:rubrerythrin
VRSQALKTAIAFEERERRFFSEAAATARNPAVARLFSSLAVEELEHRLELEESLPRPSRPAGAGGPSGSSVTETAQGFFLDAERTGQPEGLLDADQFAALEAAMETEKRGLALYDQFLTTASREEDRAFLCALKAQEGDHLAALQEIWDRLNP